MKKILITGAGSYIGTSFNNYMRRYKDSYEVDVLDLKSKSWKKKSFVGYDVIFHVAGIAHIKETEENKDLYYKVNRDLTIEVAKKAKKEKVKHFVFLSSMSVYGLEVGKININTRVKPNSNYGKSKLMAEKALNELISDDFIVSILRPPMVYGDACKGNYNSLIKFANKLPVFPNIKNQRSMVSIYNLCKFVRKIIEKECSGIYFPQDEDYGCTSKIVKDIADSNLKNIHLTKTLNPFVKLCMKMPGRIGSMARKAFGDLIYDKDINEQISEKKKALFVATVTGHIKAFHIPYLKMFKDAGYEVNVASNGEEEILNCDKHYNICFARSPFNKSNIKAYKELKAIINENDYDVIQCNTPVGGVITRLAAKEARKNGTRVIYMAHGFHFFKGAPLKNWLIYYSVEKFLSKYTDDLITISKEDYEIANEKFKAQNVHYIHGIGVNKAKFDIQITDKQKAELRESLGIEKDDFVMAFVGELNNNKNQIMLINAMKDLSLENKKIKLLLVGDGELKVEFERKIKEFELEKNVLLLGYRNDVPDILNIVDLYVAMSKREGLPLNILEAKLVNLPVIATNTRGHRELVENNENGYIIKIGDVNELKEKILKLYEDIKLRKKFASNAKKDIEKYYLENVYEEVKTIYLA